MATIRVTCPACKSELEIDDVFEGKEVECGNCLEVFTAQKPSAPGKSAGAIKGADSDRGEPASKRKRRDDDDDDDRDRPRRRRRRRRDDDDDDDYAPPPPREYRGPEQGLGTAALVLGILALPALCFWPLAIVLGALATTLGAMGRQKERDPGLATAGMVIGIIALGLVATMFIIGFSLSAINPFR